ncbi:MAG: hypothetical protein KTR31_17935 [Myxococcales bacterium]|nr:hypothetical protein [Myxococcales bacterium]
MSLDGEESEGPAPSEDTVALMFDGLSSGPPTVPVSADTPEHTVPTGRAVPPLDTGQLLAVSSNPSEGERTLGGDLEMVVDEATGELKPLRSVLMPGDFLQDLTDGGADLELPEGPQPEARARRNRSEKESRGGPKQASDPQMSVPPLARNLVPPASQKRPRRDAPKPRAPEPVGEEDDDKTRKLPPSASRADEPTQVLERKPSSDAKAEGEGAPKTVPISGKAKLATVEDLGLEGTEDLQSEPLLVWVAGAVGLMLLCTVMLALGSMVVLLLG